MTKKDITPAKLNTTLQDVEDATILPVDADIVPAEDAGEIAPYDYPPEPTPPLDVQDIDIDNIAELENEVRPEYYGIEELAESMYAQNQLQPVCVRPAAADATHGKRWELVYGYRRLRAAQYNSWPTIRATVRDIPDDRLLEIAITENLQRANMSPIAEARAIRDMIEKGGLKAYEVAARLGKSKSHISHRLKLLDLQPEVMQLVDAGELGPSAGESIASLEPHKQLKIARKAVTDGLSVSRIENIVRTFKAPETDIPDEEIAPIERIMPEDIIDLPYLAVKPDLEADAHVGVQIDCYIMLRNGLDMEMLEYLREAKGVMWENIWDWVRTLTQQEAISLRHRLRRRYLESAHRFPSYEASLREDLGDPTNQNTGYQDRLALPSLDDLLDDEDWWGDEGEEL